MPDTERNPQLQAEIVGNSVRVLVSYRTFSHACPFRPFIPALNRLRTAYPVVSFTILSTALVIDVSRLNGIIWDCMICCEMLDVYKTRPEAYQRAARLLQLRPDELLMVACHNFDLLAARREGYRTAFVRRPQEWGDAGPPGPVPDPSIDLVVDDFPTLAAALGT